ATRLRALILGNIISLFIKEIVQMSKETICFYAMTAILFALIFIVAVS
ncbi:hypothetical protein AAULR_00490, partial [Lacticaseibacillus rhamnosus MTCC 5462]